MENKAECLNSEEELHNLNIIKYNNLVGKEIISN